MKRFIPLLCLLVTWLSPLEGQAARYGLARTAVPVLNAPAVSAVFGGRDGRTLKSDRCGQVREVEFIALPGTVFRLLGEIRRGKHHVYQVETDDYPTPENGALYVDSRFIEPSELQPPARPRERPEREAVISALKGSIGTPYVWGGNLRLGVAELSEIYYVGKFSSQDTKRLTLAGLDCSGLLYEATGGWTPRNTSGLLYWGKGLSVAGKQAAELAAMLEPLDLIAWNGHVIIVLDRDTAIESRLKCGKGAQGGVMTTPLRQWLAEIMRTRRPVDAWPAGGKQKDVFVVRRWWAP